MAAVIELVARTIPNRKDFLSDAYEKHSESLKRYLMRTVTEADAEDLMHDVYVRLAGHQGLCLIENLQAFMFKTATNILRDRWRRANALHAPTWVNVDAFDLSSTTDDPAEVSEWRERLESITEVFGKLPNKSKKAFTMSRLAGCSYAEIAGQLDVSVSMIEKHISAVLSCLRQTGVLPR